MQKTHPPTRTVNGKDLVKDIRSGMTDFELMVKHGLTVHDFNRVLGHLVDAGLITKEALQERQQLSDSQIIQAFVDFCKDHKLIY